MKYKKILILLGCASVLSGAMMTGVTAAETDTMLETEMESDFLLQKVEGGVHVLETEFLENSEEPISESVEIASEIEEKSESQEEHGETQTEQPPEEDTANDAENLTETDPEQPTKGETDIEQSTEGETDIEQSTEGETDIEQPTEGETDTEQPTEEEKNTEQSTEENIEGSREETKEIENSDTEASEEQELAHETEVETDAENVIEEGTESDTELEQDTDAETELISETELQEEETAISGSGNGSIYDTDTIWDPSWYISPDFRFTQVDKKWALAEGTEAYVYVYDRPSVEGMIVGRLPYFSLAYVLDEEGDWMYLESGDVRGFVEAKAMETGAYASALVEALGEYSFLSGIPTVSPFQNAAFTHTHTTTKDVIAKKQHGITLFQCEIKEYPKENARTVGVTDNGGLVYILEMTSDGWYFVESGDVRGFVASKQLLVGEAAEEYVKCQEDTEPLLAEKIIEPLENESLYYTLKSVKIAGSSIGTEIAETALGFVGKLRYVYGGNSLTYGSDCSGFVQSVFSSYGIALPRTAEAQGSNGEAVSSLKDAKVGDLIYYASGPHIGIYVGNGLVVQCAGNSSNTSENPGKGVTLSAVDYMPITSIRRYLIEDADVSVDGGNRLDLTSYSEQELELIWAIVAQEDNGSYEGALAVISSAMNRTESESWCNAGENALSQLTANGQYCYSIDQYWKARLGGNVPGYVKQAVYDCLKKGVRNHTYTSFRSTRGAATGNDAVQIGGNWYF